MYRAKKQVNWQSSGSDVVTVNFTALEGVCGTVMWRREKTFAAKIQDGMGVGSSSLSKQSAYTHAGAKNGLVGCLGGANA